MNSLRSVWIWPVNSNGSLSMTEYNFFPTCLSDQERHWCCGSLLGGVEGVLVGTGIGTVVVWGNV